jgi:hypothetical protein
MRPLDRLRAAVHARALPAEPSSPEAVLLARALAAAGGGSVRAVAFFGSRKTGAGHDPWSAWDLFVTTGDYRGFYRALRSAGQLGRPAWLVAALNACMPPNQIAFRGPAGSAAAGALAKCAVLTLAALGRETSPRRRDHFCIGRLFQPVELLFWRNDADREAFLDALVAAHVASYAWSRPWLPPRFDAESYARGLLAVSMGGELRPEPRGRAEALFAAQREYLVGVYGLLLDALAEDGELRREAGGGFSLARPVSAAEGLRVRLYFARSKFRATARWLKYVVTFEGWLEYIVRKAERHTGESVVLSPWERRLPVPFLLPRVVRHLRRKPPGGA